MANLLDVIVKLGKMTILPQIDDLNRIPKGDMPGDKIHIESDHIKKAEKIFPILIEKLIEILNNTISSRAVISIYGGSGVGKSEIGALIAYYFKCFGIGSYVLSGDNYPHRIPEQNDIERLRCYRTEAVKGLVKKNLYTADIKDILTRLWTDESDFNKNLIPEYPWLSVYQDAGYAGLSDYLAGDKEIDFHELNYVIQRFKSGKNRLFLKRLGRKASEYWYDEIDLSDVRILLIEWTHGNNPALEGVDIPVFLNSTPEETLKHRLQRSRDGNTDSPLISTVLQIEHQKLMQQVRSAGIIITKSGEIVNSDEIEIQNAEKLSGIGPMLNAYPDSIGGSLGNMISLLQKEVFNNCFESFYILPSLYNSDLDRGFSVIDYNINGELAERKDLTEVQALNIDLKLDFILNHASVLSPQFQDLLKKGRQSEYYDFFIDWNKFWEGYGELNDDGIIIPDEEYIKDMFFRKPGLPLLQVRLPNGEDVPFWNTFYQEVRYMPVEPQTLMNSTGVLYSKAVEISEKINHLLANGISPSEMELDVSEDVRNKIAALIESERRYLGQMDLNIESPLVWQYYEKALKTLASYGAGIVRLDAFAYAPKTPGKRNFLNESDTWNVLHRIKKLADGFNLKLLPEIHARYEEKIHTKISDQGFAVYDFFFPGLLIHAIEGQSAVVLKKWISEIIENNIVAVNMLGCHDGIPLLDLKGLLTEDQIQDLIDTIVSRGGYVKDLHSRKNMYYQVNATYFSALGEDEARLVFSRAVQIFMPGKPQVWYLDLFAGKNDLDAVKKAGGAGHKEINRTNLTSEEATLLLKQPVVQRQLELLRFRKLHPAFSKGAVVSFSQTEDSILEIKWENKNTKVILAADFSNCTYKIEDSTEFYDSFFKE